MLMKTLVAAVAAVAAVLAFSPPALAEEHEAEAVWVGAPPTVPERAEWLEHRIMTASEDHEISKEAADHAVIDLHAIKDQIATMRERDGGTLNDVDRAYLEGRLDRLATSLHWAHRHHSGD
jgi:membrane-bound lytic murein transglycosylase B